MMLSSTVAKRRMRTSKEEMVILEQYFAENKNPNTEKKREIAKSVQMSERSIHFWFQNRRAKENKKNKLKGQHPKKTNKDDKSPQQLQLRQQPSPVAAEAAPNVAGTYHHYSTKSKDKHPHLPPISTFVNYRTPIGLDISYYFHHNTFGIEESMKQWSDYQHDHQAHY
ncbi:Homeodomain-like protein [Parasitella parasitica]|nr:Homeodomain-like protein [Parasitella parasitica]